MSEKRKEKVICHHLHNLPWHVQDAARCAAQEASQPSGGPPSNDSSSDRLWFSIQQLPPLLLLLPLPQLQLPLLLVIAQPHQSLLLGWDEIVNKTRSKKMRAKEKQNMNSVPQEIKSESRLGCFPTRVFPIGGGGPRISLQDCVSSISWDSTWLSSPWEARFLLVLMRIAGCRGLGAVPKSSMSAAWPASRGWWAIYQRGVKEKDFWKNAQLIILNQMKLFFIFTAASCWSYLSLALTVEQLADFLLLVDIIFLQEFLVKPVRMPHSGNWILHLVTDGSH